MDLTKAHKVDEQSRRCMNGRKKVSNRTRILCLIYSAPIMLCFTLELVTWGKFGLGLIFGNPHPLLITYLGTSLLPWMVFLSGDSIFPLFNKIPREGPPPPR